MSSANALNNLSLRGNCEAKGLLRFTRKDRSNLKNGIASPLARNDNYCICINKGFTLIEAIIVMIILGICLTPFAILVVNVMSQNIYSQAQATAVALAESETERVTNLRFFLVNDEAQAPFSAPFSAYNHEIIVDYVNAGDLNTAVAGPTDYKRAQIRVTNSISGSVTLTTLVTRDW